MHDYWRGLLMPIARNSVDPIAVVTAPAKAAAKASIVASFCWKRAVVGRLAKSLPRHLLPTIIARTARRSRGRANSFALTVFHRVALALPPADPSLCAGKSLVVVLRLGSELTGIDSDSRAARGQSRHQAQAGQHGKALQRLVVAAGPVV
jgi:hypothetical protein